MNVTTSTSRRGLTVAAIAVIAALAPATSAVAQHTDTARARAAALGTVNWQINLSPSSAFPRARGSSQYQTQPGQAEFQAEVEHVPALRGRLVTVSVNGAAVGSARVSPLGIAHLERNSELGQRVPVIGPGSIVSITTSTGTVIVSGSY
jgi:hypothetical protein